MRRRQHLFLASLACLCLPMCAPSEEPATRADEVENLSVPRQRLKTASGNPFLNTVQYVNPDYTANTQISASQLPAGSSDAGLVATVGKYPTAIWLDSMNAIAGGSSNGGRLGLIEHLDNAAALAQSSGKDAVLSLVIYDLPNRDCAALASNGELQGTAGLATYKSGYIDVIYAAISQAKYQHVRVVAVMEPDSLPNLVTNLSVPACAEANNDNLYIGGVTYALQKLGSLSNVYAYLDIAHSGWLGWTNNMSQAVALYKQVVSGVSNGDFSVIRGFATDIANYTPLVEPYMNPSDNAVLNGGFYQSNPCFDELSYIKALSSQFTSAGFSDFGFLIDTSRNGWPVVNDGNPIDRRPVRGDWCNVGGTGLGRRPEVAPAESPLIDAYVWVKPPGESDGISQLENSSNTPDAQGKRFDAHCDPTNPQLDALPGAPSAGAWFHDEFMMLIHNATPALTASAPIPTPTTAPTPTTPASTPAPTPTPATTPTSPTNSTSTPGTTSPTSSTSPPATTPDTTPTTTTPASPPATPTSGTPSATGGLTTFNDEIIDANGNKVALHGFSWFGFNSGTTMMDGLWGGPALGSDFATAVWRQKLLGFNAVRLPFSFAEFSKTPRSFTENCTLPSAADVAASVTPSGATAPGTPPALAYEPTRQSGSCNEYLPSDTVFNRYVWVVQFYTRNGFYVLMDNHFREDQTVLTAGTQSWASQWANLVQTVLKDPSTHGKIFVDVLNEPDNYGLVWEGGNGKPALGDLYLAAMDAIYPVAPGVVYFVEGTGQGALGANWGDGFSTDANLLTSGVSDPRAFFKTLGSKPYSKQVVISPHVYGPAVTGATAAFEGASLYKRLSNTFGYLTKQGYCGDSSCKQFPVAVGEFGSKFVDTNDEATMTGLATYLNNTADAVDGRHNTIPNWFYWDWNADSGDTGGLVEDDWVSLAWVKLQYLTTLGLSPWYNGGTTVTPTPTPATTPPTPTPAPTPTPTPGTTPTTSPSPAGACTVKVQASAPWQQGSGYVATVNLFVSNGGSAQILPPWTLTLTQGQWTTVNQAWNWSVSGTKGGTVTGVANQSWETLSPNGGNAVNLGMQLESSGSTFMPTAATLNGVSCKITP